MMLRLGHIGRSGDMIAVRLALVFCTVLTCCTLAVADDGSVIGIGGSAELIKPEHASIRMVRERVDAQVLRCWATPPRVRCEFVFKNEGTATTVKMGFPEESRGDIAPSPKSKVSALHGYLSWVDGQRVKTRLVPSSKYGNDAYTAWHVKDVHFAAGQTRKVVDSYSGGMGGDVMGYRSFNYVLKTGASWKGPIGEAVIRVDVRDMLRACRIDHIEPKGYKLADGIISWRLKEFEPKEDVSITFSPLVIIYMPDGGPSGYLLYERINGTSMALVRDLANALDAKSTMHGSVCTISKRNHKLRMTAGSKTAVLDGKKKIRLPIAPYAARNDDGKPDMAVPVAAVVRALGGTAELSADKTALSIKI
jgi:hypothetical protein